MISAPYPEAISHLREKDFSHTIQIGTSIETSQICIDLAHSWYSPCDRWYSSVKRSTGYPCWADTRTNSGSRENDPDRATCDSLILRDRIRSLSPIKRSSKLKYKRETNSMVPCSSRISKNTISCCLHTRNCSETTLTELQSQDSKNLSFIALKEDWTFAEKYLRFISAETKISFTGILTYPKSTTIQEVAQKLSSPSCHDRNWCPPISFLKIKNESAYCEPSYSLSVYEKLCSLLRTESHSEIEETLWKTLFNFFFHKLCIPKYLYQWWWFSVFMNPDWLYSLFRFWSDVSSDFFLIMMGVSVVLTGGSLVGLILLLIKNPLSWFSTPLLLSVHFVTEFSLFYTLSVHIFFHATAYCLY